MISNLADGLVPKKSPTSYLEIVRRASKSKMEADLLGRVLDEANTGLDVSLQSLDGLIKELLLVVVCFSEDVDGFLGTVWLIAGQSNEIRRRHGKIGGIETLTPSSTGTEKKSQPVSFAIASPPSTPGR